MTIHESQQLIEEEAEGVFLDDVGSSSSSTGRITPDNPLFKGNSARNKSTLATLIDTQLSPLIPSEIHSPPRHGTLPESFHGSPEPIRRHLQPASANSASPVGQPYHLLGQIHENEISQEKPDTASSGANKTVDEATKKKAYFVPCYPATRLVFWISTKCFEHEDFAVATWMGFWALHNVTCANYVLSPMRDAVALQVGVKNIPKLTLASSVLAFLSSVPIGWLFEAPDPGRRKLWKKCGLTRGETQGTSLALFYRFFALSVLSYAAGFKIMDWWRDGKLSWLPIPRWLTAETSDSESNFATIMEWVPFLASKLGKVMYIAFFLVVHLMKLHSISLVWGVTSEAMEYEDVARKGQQRKLGPRPKVTRTRLERLAMVGFGGTLGGLWGR